MQTACHSRSCHACLCHRVLKLCSTDAAPGQVYARHCKVNVKPAHVPSTLSMTRQGSSLTLCALPPVTQVAFHVHRPLLANVAPPAPAAPAEEGEIEERDPAVPEGMRVS